MKLFQVTYEQDGETTREQGKTSTDIVRMTSSYCAESIGIVLDAIVWMLEDGDITVISVAEVLPHVSIIK